jgi:phospholipase C
MATKQIKHVIYYMLENRSFDNLLGWLYDENNPPKQIISNVDKPAHPFYGLTENTYSNLYNKDGSKNYVEKGSATLSMPNPDPHEAFDHMTFQIFGHSKPQDNEVAKMSGFLNDYGQLSGVETSLTDEIWSGTASKQNALQILTTYTPEQLPVINGLAKHYAVSDQWFACVPSQTNCNRAFSLCGTSLGLVNNGSGKFNTRTIWHVLNENGHSSPDDWMIYYQSSTVQSHWKFWQDCKFCYTEETFNVPDPQDHVANIDDFFAAVKEGRLPAFSYLEPDWIGDMSGALEFVGDTVGSVASVVAGQKGRDLAEKKIATSTPNSYHPPSEVQSGEQFLKKLFEVMNSTPQAKAAWQETVLIISFDENGGIFDHVSPPWGATPPWGDGKPDFALEEGFKFNRFGVRVPTIIISPWVDEQTVFRSMTDVPYDHTSTIATILNWKGIAKDKWGLGERVANAPTWEGVLSRTTPRTDFPSLDLTSECQAVVDPKTLPVSPLQASVLPKVLNKASNGQLTEDQLNKATTDMLNKTKSLSDLHQSIVDFTEKHASTPTG